MIEAMSSVKYYEALFRCECLHFLDSILMYHVHELLSCETRVDVSNCFDYGDTCKTSP